LSGDNTRVDGWLDDGLLDLCTRRIEVQSLQGEATPIPGTEGVFAYPRPTGAFSIDYLEDTTNNKILTRFDGGFGAFLRAKQNQTNHAFRDLGDPEQAGIVLQEFMEWLSQRDTAVRRTTRHHAPVRGIQPYVSHRSSRTGV
jgi:hypothetical protein